jgi:hypothetical protein
MSQRNEVCGPRLLDAREARRRGIGRNRDAALELDGRIEN